MAISVYTGVMGSGKTYEVVGYVIAPALAAGRRVVTNIAGFNYDEAYDFCIEKLKAKPGYVGEIVVVEDDDVQRPSFFPSDDNSNSIVRPGDLVVIDECWRFWGADGAISEASMEFFRKHRHLTHPETGVACDLVLITQAVSDLHRKLKNVVELSFRAKKAKSLGLNSIYVVEMWEGTNQRRKSVSAQTRRYDSAIFPLYKSYSGATDAAGKEVAVDKRHNVLKSWKFMLGAPALVLLGVYSVWGVVSFFDPKTPAKDRATERDQATLSRAKELASAEGVKSGRVGSSSADGQPIQSQTPARQTPTMSAEWRLSGFVSFGERRVVLVINNAGRVRAVSPSMFSFSDGRPVTGTIDGQTVTEWTGSLAATASQPPLISMGEVTP